MCSSDGGCEGGPECLDDEGAPLIPPADPDKPCPHEAFEAFVEVNRVLADGADPDAAPTAFVAEVAVRCAQCEEPFRWVGVPAGLSGANPTCATDGLILNAPLRPASSDPDFGLGMQGFAVTAHTGDGE